jgi:anti-anti-sigma factor
MADISVLCPQGRLDNATGPALGSDISKSIAGGATKLLLDMAGISYISSAGLRVVLIAAKQMKSMGGHLVLCSLNSQTMEVFETSGFTRFIDISGSHDEAMTKLTG